MFTAVAHKNLGDTENYFDEHLAQNDYYAVGEIRPGQWIGAGAERLGLNNVVTREQFHALCENQNPNDGERLTLRQLKEDKRRVFYDFTCSAPKSVSVLAVTLDDDRLVKAREAAARIAFRELETFAATRVRKQGKSKRPDHRQSRRRRVHAYEQPRTRPAVAHALHGVQRHV
jgi:conjugative relaxase-like TrwC/TraI family protein